MSLGIEAVVEIVEGIIESGVHLLDPEERKKTVRERVQVEASKWAAADPGLVSTKADAITASHRVAVVVPALSGVALIDAAQTLRGLLSSPLTQSEKSALALLLDHHDPQPSASP